MRTLRLTLLILGAALFLSLLIRIGPGVVVSLFAGLSWYLPLILIFPYALMTTCDALGWRFAFRQNKVPFRALLAARLAGEAFNLTTPLASVGGEAVKAGLIRPHVSLTESVPAVVIAKTTIAIGQVLYLLLGLLVGLAVLPRESALLRVMTWLLGLEFLGVGGFVAVQVLGALGAGASVLRRAGFPGGQGAQETLGRVDSALGQFYRKEPRRLTLSIVWHFIGCALGGVEAYVILWALGLPVSLATAVVIDALGIGIGFAAFLIPARLGATEAGTTAVFVALGLGAPAGLTFALVQRLREATWAGLGFLGLTMRRATALAPPGAPLEVEG